MSLLVSIQAERFESTSAYAKARVEPYMKQLDANGLCLQHGLFKGDNQPKNLQTHAICRFVDVLSTFQYLWLDPRLYCPPEKQS